jgi:hypothetical protein
LPIWHPNQFCVPLLNCDCVQRPKEAFAGGHVVLSTYLSSVELRSWIKKAEHSLRHSATGIDESHARSQVRVWMQSPGPFGPPTLPFRPLPTVRCVFFKTRPHCMVDSPCKDS